MLYGCAAWTLTKQLATKVLRTQRKMLRLILGSRRKPSVTEDGDVESWVDWLRRTTHEAEDRLAKLNMDDWITIHRQKKLEWARKLAMEESITWAGRLAEWQPDHFTYTRRQARPRRRWSDDICDSLKAIGVDKDWMNALRDDAVWCLLTAL